MKRILLLTLCLFYYLSSYCQLNIDSVGQLPYNIMVNDVWGYAAPDGTEYALVGTSAGVSVVSLANPELPTEVAFVSGGNSSWRDMKSWNDRAYVTTEANDGLLVIDMANLPDTVTHYFWQPTLEGGTDSLQSCHNLYIDENGYCYLSGCNLNNGGFIIVDIFTNPDAPEIVGLGPTVYSHDIYVRDNMAYSSDIEVGELSIHDVTDKESIVFVSQFESPFRFTHNAWLSDDGNVIFTTDELSNAPTAAYDISDLQDIQLLDEFVPAATRGRGVIPHNVHYIDGYLSISHYGNGLVIVDANRPNNLVEVGNFDTAPNVVGGFGGAWGAYPYLPSGLTLISDSQTGLHVVRPTYKRAAYLEGQITDATTGEGIVGAIIAINGTDITALTDASGVLKTGHAESGSYEITISKRGFISQTITVDLSNGEIAPLNIALERAPTYVLTGTVVDEQGQPINDVPIILSDGLGIETLSSNGSGQFVLDQALSAAAYQVIYGKWGFLTDTLSLPVVTVEGEEAITSEVVLTLMEGIADPFALDLAWTVTEENIFVGGGFERGTPVISPDVPFINEDVPEDIGTACYSTGNSESLPDNVFIIGRTVLTSPVFDMSNMMEPTISYSTIYGNVLLLDEGLFEGSENLNVYLDNGQERVLIEGISNSFIPATLTLPTWLSSTITVRDFIEPTAAMTISFELESDNFDSVSEAGVDNFRAFDAGTVSVNDFIEEDLHFRATPNPFDQEFLIEYEESDWQETPTVVLFDVLGKIVFQKSALSNQNITVPNDLPTGTYFLQLRTLEKGSKVLKLLKTE